MGDFEAGVHADSAQETQGHKPGDQQKHQGCGHLAGHEEIAQAEAAIAAQRRLRPLFQGDADVGARRGERRRQAEAYARRHRNRQRDGDHVEIELAVELERDLRR